MNQDRKKIVITLIFVFILIIIAIALSAFLPYGWSKEGVPPILPAELVN